MSFTPNSADKFSTVFDQTDYNSFDPIVKVQYVQKGNNIVFGRTLKNGDYANLIYVGKVIESTQGKNYLSANAWLDTTFPHVIYITGTRGSGKSFDLGVLLEGISELSAPSPIQNAVDPICSILIDTQSQFWTLKYQPNENVPENKKQLEELRRWNIQPNSVKNCKIYVPPSAEQITGDEVVFTIKPSLVSHEEWCALISEDIYSPQGHIMGVALEELKRTNGDNFSLDDIIQFIQDDHSMATLPEISKNVISYKLDGYRRTGLFSAGGLNVVDLLKPGQCSVFMLRDLRNVDKSLVTSIIARQLFTIMGEFHKKRKVAKFFNKNEENGDFPSKVWLLIDEAHVIAPRGEGAPAKDVLIEYVKRGRDSGLSLVLATQQPSAIDDKILSQVNVTFSHRLTFQSDINAATDRIPTKLLHKIKFSGIEVKEFGDILRYLDAGQCFIGDHSTSRVVLTQIRPRVTSHGGYSPI